jgi:predicted nucleic acid-binding protein
MQLKQIYFLDTYSIIEIILGNENYNFLKEKVGLITTSYNLMELYYYCLREYDEEIAEKYYGIFETYLVEIENDIIKSACKFRLKHKKCKLSFADCIGYLVAKNQNAIFVTGDKEFEDMDNVLFKK